MNLDIYIHTLHFRFHVDRPMGRKSKTMSMTDVTQFSMETPFEGDVIVN